MSKLKRYPENKFKAPHSLLPIIPASDASQNPILSQYDAPGKKSASKARLPVFIALSMIVALISYSIWTTFFRYEAVGIIDAVIVKVSSPVNGSIKKLNVKDGSRVEQNQLVMVVENLDLQRELAKTKDEIEVTKAEINSRHSELGWRLGGNHEIFHRAQGEQTATEGELADLKARLILYSATLERLKRLQAEKCVSAIDLDKAQAEYSSTLALIESKKNTLKVMKTRLASSRPTISDTGYTQVTPAIEKLKFLKNEEKRLREKILEGRILSPVSGILSNINHFEGERINQDPVFNVVIDNSCKMVLFYKTNVPLPKIGKKIKIWSPNKKKSFSTEVTGYSKDTYPAPDQIKRDYEQDAKLIKVFLKPLDTNIDDFIVGSIIQKARWS